MTEDYNKNQGQRYRGRYEDEGVFYTPRNLSRASDKGKAFADDDVFQKTPPRKKKVKRGTPPNYGVFIALTVGVGIIVCLFIFIVVFSSMSKNNQSKKVPTNRQSVEQDFTDVVEFVDVTALIKDVTDKRMELVNILNEKEISISISETTALKDKYGSNMTASEFKEGDIVDVEYNSLNNYAESVHISGEAWEQKNVNVKIDPVERTISVANQKYSYSESTLLLNASNLSSIDEIIESDTVTIKGMRQMALSVSLEKSHGYMLLSNRDKIVNGIIEVDTNIFMKLEDADKIQLTEGVHKVVVKGDNIEPFVKEIRVGVHEEVEVDLSNVQIKTGVLIFRLAEKDYTVYVDNDTISNPSEPLVLDYNTYTVKVQKEGYETYEKNISINKASTTLSIELDKETKLGSLTIDTNPSGVGADVYIDNSYIGVAPVTTQVEQGEHKILIRKNGYSDISVPVTVTEVPQELTIKIHELPTNTPTNTQTPSTNINVHLPDTSNTNNSNTNNVTTPEEDDTSMTTDITDITDINEVQSVDTEDDIIIDPFEEYILID